METVFPKYGREDRGFAAAYLAVGYGFIYVFTGTVNTWALSLFTVFYAVMVLLYLWAKGRKPPAESWFWLGVLLAVGIPFAFWTVLYIWQIFALMAVAAYWTLSASGRLLSGRTSQWVFFDGCNALLAVPFGNFGCQARVLFTGSRAETDAEGTKEEKKKPGSSGGAVLLGVLLAVPALVIILPLLSSADAGFERLAGTLADYISEHLMATLLRFLFSIPVSFYLFGLIFGGVTGRKTGGFQKEKLQETGCQVRFLPDMAACTALGILCLVYMLFMGIQGNYLFSAFSGNLPEDFTYAEYARRGFFELCQIGLWNLVLLGLAGIFSRSEIRRHRGLSFVTVLLSTLTLLLLFTAMSKMVMYISVYGLTVNRILPMVFMIWMALVFLSVIARQKQEFPMVRLCVMAGAVLFCLLCLFPVEDWTAMYNAWARARGLIV